MKPMPRKPDANMTAEIVTLRRKTANLRDARVAEAESFLRHRINAATDGRAKAMAVVETKSEVDIAEAEYEIAKAMLQLTVLRYGKEA